MTEKPAEIDHIRKKTQDVLKQKVPKSNLVHKKPIDAKSCAIYLPPDTREAALPATLEVELETEGALNPEVPVRNESK
jgi:hypothetical protein